MDAASVMLFPERRRVLETRKVRYNHISSGKPKKRSVMLFGFMALLGNDVVMKSDKGDAVHLTLFLDSIREANPGKRIFIVCDNASIHHANLTICYAISFDIYLIFLPSYSPDLNPIEFSWKDMKRELNSCSDFDEVIENAEKVALQTMKKGKGGYSKKWRENFMPLLSVN